MLLCAVACRSGYGSCDALGEIQLAIFLKTCPLHYSCQVARVSAVCSGSYGGFRNRNPPYDPLLWLPGAWLSFEIYNFRCSLMNALKQEQYCCWAFSVATRREHPGSPRAAGTAGWSQVTYVESLQRAGIPLLACATVCSCVPQ